MREPLKSIGLELGTTKKESRFLLIFRVRSEHNLPCCLLTRNASIFILFHIVIGNVNDVFFFPVDRKRKWLSQKWETSDKHLNRGSIRWIPFFVFGRIWKVSFLRANATWWDHRCRRLLPATLSGQRSIAPKMSRFGKQKTCSSPELHFKDALC